MTPARRQVPARRSSALVLVLAGACLLATPVRADDATFAEREAARREALWGRDSHVPDWRTGETADREATAFFLATRVPSLDGWPGEDRRMRATSDREAISPSASVFAFDYWAPPGPEVVGASGKPPGSHHLFAAQGESEPLALAVRLGGRGAEVRMSVADLVADGARISRQDASIRFVLPYRSRTKSGKRPAPQEVQPMVLLAPADDTWWVPADYTVGFVVDFHVPADATPRAYRTQVGIHVAGQLVTEVPVTLRVLPFRLKTNGFHAGAFGTTFDLWTGGFTGYYPEMMEMDSRYGFNLAGAFFNKGNEVPFARTAAGGLAIDRADPRFGKFDRTMQRLRSYGMGDVVFWNWGASGKVRQFNDVLRHAGAAGPVDTDAGKQAFADMVCALRGMRGERGWPEIVLNPFDEALKDQDATRELIGAAEVVNRRCPGARLYMTEWRPGYARHYQSSGRHLQGSRRPRERARRALDSSDERPRLNFAVIGSNTLDAAGRRLQDGLGGEYWHYTGISRPGPQARFAFGFKPWIRRSEAVLMWANYKGDLLNNGWTLHHVLSRDPNGRANGNTRGPVVPSVRALAVREGIDDRKYLETLHYHAVRLGSARDLALLDGLARKAEALLLNRDRIGGLENVEAAVADGEALQAMRARLSERIVALLEAEAAGRAP